MSKVTIGSRINWWVTHPKGFLDRIAGEIYFRLHPDEPWISHHAVRFLDKNLSKAMTGIEWGSGRSTIWYAQRLSHLTSVEHDKGWSEAVQNKIKDKNIKNINYRFVEMNHPVDGPTHPYYDTTPDYVGVVDAMPDGSLDFAVIDGAYRQACLIAVQKKLKKGGYLLLDNSNWMSYKEWHAPEWPIAHRSNGYFGETTIWEKP